MIMNSFGVCPLLPQTFEDFGDSLISRERYLGGEKLEYEHRTVYSFSQKTYVEDLEYSHDSLSALGPFRGLEKLDFSGGTIYYNPDIAEVINKLHRNLDPADPLFDSTSAMADDPILIKSPITFDGDQKFIIAFSWGPSDDFSFDIYRDDDEKTWAGWMNGHIMYVPGNGYVYAEGHVNNCFNHRKKYKFQNGEFVEAPQAFYYVGLKTYTTAPIKLYSDTTYTEIVATLVENQPVEVLIADFNDDPRSNDGHDYLIKTPFGLTGWLRVIDCYPRVWGIKGLYYAGD
jgi:hypothetical protein